MISHREDSIKEINEREARERIEAENLTAVTGTVIDLEYRMILMGWGVAL